MVSFIHIALEVIGAFSILIVAVALIGAYFCEDDKPW